MSASPRTSKSAFLRRSSRASHADPVSNKARIGTSTPRRLHARLLAVGALAFGAAAVVALLIWQGITAAGNPNPAAQHLGRTAVILDSAILVLREGLEAILVLAALTASFVGAQAAYRRPVAGGVAAGLLATVATWFVVVAIIGAVNAPALYVQAITGLLAIAVLLVVMNWFFHKVYWTGWISHHNNRRRSLVALGPDGKSRLMLGLGLLGFTAIYREGFEVVLFLQSLRLQAGTEAVLWGVSLGSACTAVVGVLTFLANRKLPYKKMLILTGVMLGFVLVVMTGESVQELQLAGWLPVTSIPLPIPGWMGLWFALSPNTEGIAAQIVAALIVVGSYFVAEDLRIHRPRRRARLANQTSTPAGTKAR